jgi:hypothetical protein
VLLDVSKHIIHICVVTGMVCATSVSMRGGRELHVHQRLVGEVLVFRLELRRVMGNV